jgi:hypothetical protein
MVKERRSQTIAVFAFVGCLAASSGSAQDFSVLRINEVISNNEATGPTDSKGAHFDMVEIFNSGEVPLTLGSSVFADRLALSDTATQPPLGLWTFPAAPTSTVIPPKGFLIVFLEDDPQICDLHANFALDKEGGEPVTLWGRAATDGKRQIIDQVWLPPLSNDVSFGRFPDGAGPAPVPVEQTLQHLGFNPTADPPIASQGPTFGTCQGQCADFSRACTGAPNNRWANLAPRVTRFGHSTNHPATNEPVEIVAKVKDDKEPTSPNISRVFIRFTVNDGTPVEVDMVFDADTGIVSGASQGQPLDRWTLWKGSIPGQPKDARIDFTLHVADADGLTGGDPNPHDLCEDGKGPCNVVGLPGEGCKQEPSGPRFEVCDVPFRYVVGYEPPDRLKALVINEVMAAQTNVLRDPTDAMFDDWLEIYNGSDVEVDLSGLWLSDKAFHPQGWQFPAGSKIAPKSSTNLNPYLVVWADGDGGLCPRPLEKVPGDGQDCPDPTSPSLEQYHTNFSLEKNGDELYLYDVASTGFGVIHGVEFGIQEVNVSWSLIPDGDRNGSFIFGSEPTPGDPNKGSAEPIFLRGEADGNCLVNITDAVFILNHLFSSGMSPRCPDAADTDDSGLLDLADGVYLLNHLFQGGPAPKPPSVEPGVDPTEDDLGACESVSCP